MNLPQLGALYLTGNKITNIPEGIGPLLGDLYVDYNVIRNISHESLARYPNLGRLEISGNILPIFPNISDISSKLYTITASESQIEIVPPDHLLDLPALTWLTLRGNRISHISLAFAVTSPTLAKIYLEDNALVSVDPFPEGRSFELVLTGNSLDCSSLCWMEPYFKSSDVQCAAPAHLDCLQIKDIFSYPQCYATGQRKLPFPFKTLWSFKFLTSSIQSYIYEALINY